MIPLNLMQVMLSKEKVTPPRSYAPEVLTNVMEIVLNTQSRDIPPGSSLQQIVNDLLGENQKSIAVALNDKVIPKLLWNDCILKSKDNILIIKATPGG